MQNQKGNIILIIAGIIAILAIGGGAGYFFAQESMQKEQAMEQVQKQEQKIQQEVKDETAGWKKESLGWAEGWVEFKIPNEWELVGKNDELGFVLKNSKSGREFSFIKNAGRGGPSTEYLVRYDGKIVDGRIILSNREFIETDTKSEFFRKGASAVIASVDDGRNNYTMIDEGLGDYESVEKVFLKIVENILLVDETSDASAIASATADWKVYRNEKYGFEVKYPNNWSDVEELPENKFSWHNSIVELRLGCPKIFSFDPMESKYCPLSVAIKPAETKEDYLKRINSSGDVSNAKNINIGDYEAIKYYESGYAGNVIGAIFSPSFLIEVSNIGLAYDYNSNVFDQILSTFKFTK